MSKSAPEKEATAISKAILKRINSLKQEDERLYNILAIDVWALVQNHGWISAWILDSFYEKSRESFEKIYGWYNQ